MVITITMMRKMIVMMMWARWKWRKKKENANPWEFCHRFLQFQEDLSTTYDVHAVESHVHIINLDAFVRACICATPIIHMHAHEAFVFTYSFYAAFLQWIHTRFDALFHCFNKFLDKNGRIFFPAQERLHWYKNMRRRRKFVIFRLPVFDFFPSNFLFIEYISATDLIHIMHMPFPTDHQSLSNRKCICGAKSIFNPMRLLLSFQHLGVRTCVT